MSSANPLPSSLGEIIALLPSIAHQHARSTTTYQTLDQIVRSLVVNSPLSLELETAETPFGSYGSLAFPFVEMGAISTLDLFGLDELIIFAFYWVNRERYRIAADIGANLGLHSILMGKCGWHVAAYEPDPNHAIRLLKNVQLNNIKTISLVEAAVSDQPGTHEFVRVLGNTTSSHLVGAKNNAYGDLEKFPVQVESIAEIMSSVDFVKMDAEGQEKTIILGTLKEHWQDTDMMVEVGSEDNAISIYNHIKKLGVHAYAQKLGWSEVKSIDDMPMHYKQGSLFITQKLTMPWA